MFSYIVIISLQTGGGVNEGTLHAYCWMYAHLNLPADFRGKCVKREHDGTTLYNSYYQWIAIFLVMSALLFYIPRALWLMFEGGLMKFLSKGATGKVRSNVFSGVFLLNKKTKYMLDEVKYLVLSYIVQLF